MSMCARVNYCTRVWICLHARYIYNTTSIFAISWLSMRLTSFFIFSTSLFDTTSIWKKISLMNQLSEWFRIKYEEEADFWDSQPDAGILNLPLCTAWTRLLHLVTTARYIKFNTLQCTGTQYNNHVRRLQVHLQKETCCKVCILVAISMSSIVR